MAVDLKKAVKDGHISQKQLDKMPTKMLEGLVASKKKKGPKKVGKKIPKGSHKMPDGSVMKNKDMKKKGKN